MRQVSMGRRMIHERRLLPCHRVRRHGHGSLQHACGHGRGEQSGCAQAPSSRKEVTDEGRSFLVHDVTGSVPEGHKDGHVRSFYIYLNKNEGDGHVA